MMKRVSGVALVGDTRSLYAHECYVRGPVVAEDDLKIGPFCYLEGPLHIGGRTRIWPHVTIGTEGEHNVAKPAGTIRIGNGVRIREYVAVQRGTGDRETTVGDGCFIMHGCHVAHDCVLDTGVTLSPKAVLGGHTRVHAGATLGIGAMTHQHTTIGAYAMVGMGAVVTKDVPPFCIVVGNPARFHGLNKVGLKRANVPADRVWVEGAHVRTTERLVQSALDRFYADRREDRRRVLEMA